MQILDELHCTHMGIGKMQLLAKESVYWISMNADTECMVKQCTTMFEVLANTVPRKGISL